MSSDRKAIMVTGAGRGLGHSIIKYFSIHQWTVIPLVKKNKDAKNLRVLLGENCLPILSDVTQGDSTDRIRQHLQKIGKIDVLVNNAGIGGQGHTLAETNCEHVRSLIDVHCIGALRMTQAVLPYFRSKAVVVNISSRFGSISTIYSGQLDHIPCSYAYRIAKAAQNMLTQCMVREFYKSGLKIFSVHPGQLKTGTCSVDASENPDKAAGRLFHLLEKAEHGRLYNIFDGKMEW